MVNVIPYVNRFFMMNVPAKENRDVALHEWYSNQENFDDAFNTLRSFYTDYMTPRIDNIEEELHISHFITVAVGAGEVDHRFCIAEHNFRDQYMGDYDTLYDALYYLGSEQKKMFIEQEISMDETMDEYLATYFKYCTIWASVTRGDTQHPIILSTIDNIIAQLLSDTLNKVINQFIHTDIRIEDNGEVTFNGVTPALKNVRRKVFLYVMKEYMPELIEKISNEIRIENDEYILLPANDEPESYLFGDMAHASSLIRPDNFDGSITTLNKLDIDIHVMVEDEVSLHQDNITSHIRDKTRELWEKYKDVTPIRERKITVTMLNSDEDN